MWSKLGFQHCSATSVSMVGRPRWCHVGPMPGRCGLWPQVLLYLPVAILLQQTALNSLGESFLCESDFCRGINHVHISVQRKWGVDHFSQVIKLESSRAHSFIQMFIDHLLCAACWDWLKAPGVPSVTDTIGQIQVLLGQPCIEKGRILERCIGSSRYSQMVESQILWK